MARGKSSTPILPEPVEFKSAEQIDRGIAKLKRRIQDVENLDLQASAAAEDGKVGILENNTRNTIREVFGEGSPEFQDYKYIEIWAGPLFMGMPQHEVVAAVVAGRGPFLNRLQNLIDRLEEKKRDLVGDENPRPSTYFRNLNLHPRILDVAEELFMDGHHWDAVFAASKALVNYVKERSGLDFDGAKLMTNAFSKNNPVLAFNALSDQTDLDEQEGMMHLFLGAVLAIRNPGGHSFPEGSEQRAAEYISLLSTLAYRAQEAKRRKPS